MFQKILVANRGEIAVRIIRALREMEIRAVAIFSEADRGALHVQMADEAVCDRPPRLIRELFGRIALFWMPPDATGAEAIHPGYGFFSENAAFAELAKRLGLNLSVRPGRRLSRWGRRLLRAGWRFKLVLPLCRAPSRDFETKSKRDKPPLESDIRFC